MSLSSTETKDAAFGLIKVAYAVQRSETTYRRPLKTEQPNNWYDFDSTVVPSGKVYAPANQTFAAWFKNIHNGVARKCTASPTESVDEVPLSPDIIRV